jgi:hypothetical protein
LLLIADDLGEGSITITGTGATRAIEVHSIDINNVNIVGALPNVSRFLRNGLYFSQAWAQPACSPTRASVYTGQHPWKTGVGSPVGTPELDSRDGYTTLPNLLPAGYVSGLFGKWHLGSGNFMKPTDHGWDKHFGTLDGVLRDFYDWDMVDSDTGYVETTLDGVTNPNDYATLRTVKEAAAWINGLAPDVPWFATVAFHSPHDPYHVPPGGYDPATAGNPAPAVPGTAAHYDYMFNIMMQNVDANIGRLLGTVGQAGGSRYFDPIREDQLCNTIVVIIGDNGSYTQVSLEESKMEIGEGGVRIPMIIADGHAVVNEIKGQAITPRFLHATRLNGTASLMVHVVDLYKTIVKLVDPAANAFPADTDSKDYSGVVKDPVRTMPRPPLGPVGPGGPVGGGNPRTPGGGVLPPIIIQVPIRAFNFSQIYDVNGTRATIRNAAYKLNYDDGATPEYALYKYVNGEIPNREDLGTATDLFSDALNGIDLDAQANLNVLLDELIANYRRDETNGFPDPR